LSDKKQTNKQKQKTIKKHEKTIRHYLFRADPAGNGLTIFNAVIEQMNLNLTPIGFTAIKTMLRSKREKMSDD